MQKETLYLWYGSDATDAEKLSWSGLLAIP